MSVIDWLQTSEFIRENSERVILYCLCGYFLGVTIILLAIIIVLYVDKRPDSDEELESIKNEYQVPRNDLEYNDILPTPRSFLPVYRFDGRTHQDFYNV